MKRSLSCEHADFDAYTKKLHLEVAVHPMDESTMAHIRDVCCIIAINSRCNSLEIEVHDGYQLHYTLIEAGEVVTSRSEVGDVPVHVVRVWLNGLRLQELNDAWLQPLKQLGCEIRSQGYTFKTSGLDASI